MNEQYENLKDASSDLRLEISRRENDAEDARRVLRNANKRGRQDEANFVRQAVTCIDEDLRAMRIDLTEIEENLESLRNSQAN